MSSHHSAGHEGPNSVRATDGFAAVVANLLGEPGLQPGPASQPTRPAVGWKAVRHLRAEGLCSGCRQHGDELSGRKPRHVSTQRRTSGWLNGSRSVVEVRHLVRGGRGALSYAGGARRGSVRAWHRQPLMSLIIRCCVAQAQLDRNTEFAMPSTCCCSMPVKQTRRAGGTRGAAPEMIQIAEACVILESCSRQPAVIPLTPRRLSRTPR